MRAATLLTAIAMVIPSAARCQGAADSAAIRATSLDYIEGWFSGDAKRMERALHPHLAKRMVVTDSASHRSRLVNMSALELVQSTGRGGGKETPRDQVRTDVRILDIFRHAAVVRIDAGAWIDYLELAKWNGSWLIVNVVWELRPS